jgi:polyisoprenyl-phosphate glycosyltransferase
MNYSFISVVSLVVPDEELINKFLVNVHSVLKENFSDYEIILVNNKAYKDIRPITKGLDQDIRKDVSVINLSKPILEDNALFAGLERANGDYTIIFDMYYFGHCSLIVDLYRKTQENIDIVYLKHKKRELSFRDNLMFHGYYWLMKSDSDVVVDMNVDKSRIISRRAMNSLLRLRESTRYFKGIFSFVGYDCSYIEVDMHVKKENRTLKHQVKVASLIFLSSSDILNRLFFGIFIISLLFAAGVSLDALLIKLRGSDLFGTVQNNTIPGWSFLIIMISVMFSLVCLILYLMSVYLSHINREIKQRPVYIIESIQRI